MVPPEQSADLRKYYNKHPRPTGSTRELLARLPLLHPDGLVVTPGLGPGGGAAPRGRATGRPGRRRTAGCQRLDALLELLGPWWSSRPRHRPEKAALTVLERYADPHALQPPGPRPADPAAHPGQPRRLPARSKADELLAAAAETLRLWPAGAIDFTELAEDIAAEARLVSAPRHRDRGPRRPDPPRSTTTPTRRHPRLGPRPRDHPGPRPSSGRLGDANRFRDPGRDPQLHRPGAQGRPVRRQRQRRPASPRPVTTALRQALFLAADHARKIDPTLAARYQRLRDRQQTPQQRALHPRRRSGHPDRRLLAQRPALRPARPRRPADHRSRRPRHLRHPQTGKRNGPAKQGVASAPSTGPFNPQTKNHCKSA